MPVEVEPYDHATCVGVVCQHVAHGGGVIESAVGEGDDHVVGRELCESGSASTRRSRVKEVNSRHAWLGQYLVAQGGGPGSGFSVGD